MLNLNDLLVKLSVYAPDHCRPTHGRQYLLCLYQENFKETIGIHPEDPGLIAMAVLDRVVQLAGYARGWDVDASRDPITNTFSAVTYFDATEAIACDETIEGEQDIAIARLKAFVAAVEWQKQNLAS